MKVLELFSGTECLSNAFRAKGHECFTVDWDEKFPSSLHIDILDLTPEMVLEKFGKPDVIWCAFDCTTFSLAAISKHRKKNHETGNLDPLSGYARFCDKVNKHALELIRVLDPKYFFIENPVGGLCSMDYMQGLPKYMITYCKYGFPYQKRTHIFTNHPNPQFLPPCKSGDKCHEPAPRGSRSGIQGIEDKSIRSMYPHALCEHIVEICEHEEATIL